MSHPLYQTIGHNMLGGIGGSLIGLAMGYGMGMFLDMIAGNDEFYLSDNSFAYTKIGSTFGSFAGSTVGGPIGIGTWFAMSGSYYYLKHHNHNSSQQKLSKC